MKISLQSLALLVALAACPALFSQDAGMVLRTSVSYNTLKATLPLSDEQRRQADDLGREAQVANRAGKYGDAIRSFAHGTAVMRGVPWTPAYEFVSSLQGKLDHAMLESGAHASVKLTPMYASPRAEKVKMSAAMVLAPIEPKKDAAAQKALGGAVAVDPAAAAFVAPVSLPELAVGDYTIEVRLTAEGEEPVAAARNAFVKQLVIHVEPLAEPVKSLRARLAKAPRKDGIATAEYAMVLYERADAGEITPARVNFRAEFARANTILDALEAGKDPFAGQHGDSHRAYRSAVDNSLQPYRLFIPESYDGAKATPLVVALHGMGGDENSFFDSYSNGLMKREAERKGFLVVCPKGRDTASMYLDSAEKDVLDVMADVQRTYRVDATRIYLMGHSMGGYGTWSIAMNHPDIFAALGPISGGGSAAGMAKIRHIAAYVVHGDDDRTVNVSESRKMVEAGKKAGAAITYVEVPGGSHVSVAAPAFAGMFDFFALQQKHE